MELLVWLAILVLLVTLPKIRSLRQEDKPSKTWELEKEFLNEFGVVFSGFETEVRPAVRLKLIRAKSGLVRIYQRRNVLASQTKPSYNEEKELQELEKEEIEILRDLSHLVLLVRKLRPAIVDSIAEELRIGDLLEDPRATGEVKKFEKVSRRVPKAL